MCVCVCVCVDVCIWGWLQNYDRQHLKIRELLERSRPLLLGEYQHDAYLVGVCVSLCVTVYVMCVGVLLLLLLLLLVLFISNCPFTYERVCVQLETA